MLAVPQNENRNRENTMNNLKIEYVDGQLITVDVDGVPMLDAGLTGLSFEHFLHSQPLLKLEIGGGKPVAIESQARPQSSEWAQEGELLPAETAPRRQRNRNKNRNHNRSH